MPKPLSFDSNRLCNPSKVFFKSKCNNGSPALRCDTPSEVYYSNDLSIEKFRNTRKLLP